MLSAFSGGVHPPENKYTKDRPIEVMPSPNRVYIHFSQHTGKPARPLVKKGDRVRIGTQIGECDGFVSAPIHASISGTVIALEQHPHPVIGMSLCCVIESFDEENEYFQQEFSTNDTLPTAELLNVLQDAGIVGLGGAAFPTHVKLLPPRNKPIDTLIINGCECEPMLTADYRLMIERPKGIVEGARLFQKILNAPHLVVAVEDNKKDAAVLLQNENIPVKILKTKYPQGAEKQLIKALLNREVPRNGLPMDVECIVQNVATCYAAYQAVKFRKPLIERVVTVTGNCVKESKNVVVKIGTAAIDIINFCGGYSGQPKRIIFGGPMMGIAQYSEQVPIIKATTGITVWNDAPFENEGPCVRCARCVDQCPMGLMPTDIYKFVKAKDFPRAEEYSILDCIECGCCAYNCPAKIPLVHYLKYGKYEVARVTQR